MEAVLGSTRHHYASEVSLAFKPGWLLLVSNSPFLAALRSLGSGDIPL
jgi:hypothetical protein